MKLTTLLLIIALVQASAKGFAQKINLNETNAPLEKVLSTIKQQSGYTFLYTDQQLKDEKITVKVSNADIEETLKAAFKNTAVDYKIVGNNILLKKIEASFFDRAKAFLAQVTVSGKVQDETGQPMVGVTVKVKDTQQATATDKNGSFNIIVPNENGVLIFSFIGYESQELRAKDIASRAVIILKATVSNLHEVVVNKGYYVERQELLTGNVSSVTAKEIEQQPVSNVLEALEGKVPGLFITQTTGLPGGAVKVQIRGQSSIVNGSAPFYVIDGVPYNSSIISKFGAGSFGLVNDAFNGGSPFSYINPNDIESVEILKDADATAIYGSRAANGAILITTKSGKPGPMRLNISVQTGVSSPERDISLLNTQQYLSMRREAFKNDGISIVPASAYDLTFWDTNRYTDWSKIFLQNSAIYTNANASVSGGDTNTQYLIGGTFDKQNSGMANLIPNSGVKQSASGHISFNTSSEDKKFNLLLKVNYTADLNTISGDFYASRFTPPDAPALFNSDGSLNWAPLSPGQTGTWTNPLAPAYSKYKANASNLVSNLRLSYKIFPTLELKINSGYTNMRIDEVHTSPSTIQDPGLGVSNGSSEFNNTNSYSWILEPQIDYHLKMGRGLFNAMIGATFNENKESAQDFEGANYVSDALLENPQAAGVLSSYSNATQYRYNAIRTRLNYSWDSKYIINLTANRDGSSRFGPGKQFGNFWSVGGAWVFSKEQFIQSAFPFLSFGKLRASYGLTGNDQITDYRYLDLYAPTFYSYVTSRGLLPQGLFNPTLAWEIDKKLEGGIELGFFKDRLTINASFFRNRSGNQLVSSPLSLVTGFSSIAANLPAEVQNSGQEFDVHTVNITSNHFNWSSSINLTIPHNKLLSFPGLATSSFVNKLVIGQPITIQKVYHETGVDPTTGVYQFVDAKGNPTFAPSSTTDLTTIVNTAPVFYGGFQNTVSYRGFSLDFFFQFVKQTGLNMANFINNITPGTMANIPTVFLDHWQKPGDNAKYQMLTQSSSSNASAAQSYASSSDLMYGDASYIRLQNLAFSWQFPTTWKQKMHLQSCRIFVNAQNLLTITRYDGLDPETQGLTAPPRKVWTAGIQVAL